MTNPIIQKYHFHQLLTCILLVCSCFFVLPSYSQEAPPKPKFDFEKMNADLEAFITERAGFTSEESATFLGLYREMCSEKRKVHFSSREIRHKNVDSPDSCAMVIRQLDENEIRQKSIEAEYHAKMLEVLPPCKVREAICAEVIFYRKAFRHAATKK